MDERLHARGLGAVPDWTTRFHLGGVTAGGEVELTRDRRFEAWSSTGVEVAGKRVLELGPLEGAHTAILCRAGAREVVAVEGRSDNFVKCCLVKNALALDRATFVLDDLRQLDPEAYGAFDLCLASGVLYHLEDPAALLERLAALAPVVLLWTHVASRHYPTARSVEVTLRGRRYRGKWYREPGTHRAGLGRRSFWPHLEDLRRMIADSGFGHADEIEVGWDHPEGAEWLGTLWRERSLKPPGSLWPDAAAPAATEPDPAPGLRSRYRRLAPLWLKRLLRTLLPARVRRGRDP